uniref:Uncharacterized protein n=1 Tax=Globodera rostochiensis TaxID=31243 RepID=A0A914HU94_GLORO
MMKSGRKDRLISGALRLVRPIFGGARQLASAKLGPAPQDNPPKPKNGDAGPPRLSSARLRELDILGMGPREEEAIAGDDVPSICQGDSRICKFVACTAHNFKRGQSFANLQMMAHMLGDRKMRRTVGANPEAVSDACREHGMSGSQCALFSRAFRLIDKFMATIEDGEGGGRGGNSEGGGGGTHAGGREREEKMERPKPIVPINRSTSSAHNTSTEPPPTTTPSTTPFNSFEPQNDAEIGYNTMPKTPSEPIQTMNTAPNKGVGSRTWSTHHHHTMARSLSSQLMDGRAIDENKVVVPSRPPQQMLRIPLTSNSAPPPTAHRLVETRRTLISYSSPVHAGYSSNSSPPSATVHENGTAILISGKGMTARTAQRVVPERNLARPPLMNITPRPLLVAQKASLIPYAQHHHRFASVTTISSNTSTLSTSTPATTTTTMTRRRSTIPEAEEFADDAGAEADEDVVEGAAAEGDEVTTNELKRMRDSGDYYDELASSPAASSAAAAGASNGGFTFRSRSSGGGGGSSRSNELDETEQEQKQQQQQQQQRQQQQQLDNCLQYLG